MSAITSKIEDLKAAIDRLSPRERRMVGALGATFLAIIIFGIGYWITSSLDEIEERNASIRKALKLLDKHRDTFVQQRQQLAALEVRMAHQPLELNTYVEKAASAVGVTIAETDAISPVPGEKFTRRGLEIKLNKVTISQLASLLKQLESDQAHIVQVTRLSVHTRWNRNEELDVELVVSTYDRATKQEKSSKRGRKS